MVRVMSETSERFRRVADRFTAVARAVPDDAWENPAPCEGWVARDVVRHMVEWMPGFLFATIGEPVPTLPSVDDDTVGAWAALDASVQALLDDPATASRRHESQAGNYPLEEAISRFILGDVLVHTWDLARATGGDETLDADEVHGMLEGMLPIDQVLRDSGHFGARVDVPDDADEQTRLIAFTGRQP